MDYNKARKIIVSELEALAEEEYKRFNTRIIYTVAPEKIIGVKSGPLREVAKKFSGTEVGEAFLRELPHYYFEEFQVHAALIELMKDRNRVMEELERILPYMDNWATCDCASPKIFKKNPPTLEEIRAWMSDKRPYICRFGMGMLMRYYLDERFQPEQMRWIVEVPWDSFDFRVKEGGKVDENEDISEKKIRQGSDVYYINMMRAWYFATALAKQYEAALSVIREGKLDKWTHNKAIQKARESYRVSDEHKEYLKKLKK